MLAPVLQRGTFPHHTAGTPPAHRRQDKRSAVAARRAEGTRSPCGAPIWVDASLWSYGLEACQFVLAERAQISGLTLGLIRTGTAPSG